ncbi:MAG: leucine-rich repeat domain-containing protein [Dysgonamonadaceae bacterium]|jgi:hypothetical protein|nr:leucine-rich repeat domain-containing protein [Dysgonamonadaceae bacterium]
MISRLFLFVCCLCFSFGVKAYTFITDGIRYEPIDGTTDEVRVVRNSDSYTIPGYSGAIVLPPTVVDASTGLQYRVTCIGANAFKICLNLKSVEIPNSITDIGEDAFFFSGVSSVSIPSSVKHIGYHAFFECDLKELKVEWHTPLDLTDEIPDQHLIYTTEDWLDCVWNRYLCDYFDGTLLVPQGTKLLYEEARHWKDFGKIEEYVPLGTNSASPASQVQATVVGNRLCVDSPDAEDITVYSLTGTALATYRKPAGQAWFDLPFNIQTMVIVKGSSGWRRKVSG